MLGVGSASAQTDADNFYKSDLVNMEKVSFSNQYKMKVAGNLFLPKDMKALKTLARDLYVDVPVIESIYQSNENQKKNAVETIISKGKRKVGILGLSFKAGTDDLRCSPIVDVVEQLLGKGFEIRIYDKNVRLSELTGTNKDFIMAKIPHLQHFVTDDLHSVCQESDVLVVDVALG